MAMVHASLRPGTSVTYMGTSVTDFDGGKFGTHVLSIRAGDHLILLPSPAGTKPVKGWSYGICGSAGWFPTRCSGHEKEPMTLPQSQQLQQSHVILPLPEASSNRASRKAATTTMNLSHDEDSCVQSFCSSHGIGPKLTQKMLDILSKRHDTFSEDMMYLSVQLAGAKNPEALLGQKLNNVVTDAHLKASASSSTRIQEPVPERQAATEIAAGTHPEEQVLVPMVSDPREVTPQAIPLFQERAAFVDDGSCGPTYSRSKLHRVYQFLQSQGLFDSRTRPMQLSQHMEDAVADSVAEYLRALGGMGGLTNMADHTGSADDHTGSSFQEYLESVIEKRPDLFVMVNGWVRLRSLQRQDTLEEETIVMDVPATFLSQRSVRQASAIGNTRSGWPSTSFGWDAPPDVADGTFLRETQEFPRYSL